LIPYLLEGAFVDSLLIALARISDAGSARHARTGYYGRVTKVNHWACYAERLSVSAFRGHISAEALLLKHSVWPIYSCLAGPQSAHKWAHALITGSDVKRHSNASVARTSIRLVRNWRACTSCAEYQRAKLGVSHWMVFHSLPGIRYCPWHKVPLVSACQTCGEPLFDPSFKALPGEPCTKCASRPSTPAAGTPTAGELALADLYSSILDANGPDLSPLSRTALVHAARSALGNAGSDELFIGHTLKQFDCGSEAELGSVLEHALSPGTLSLAVNAAVTASVPAALHLALAAVALKLVPEGAETSGTESEALEWDGKAEQDGCDAEVQQAAAAARAAIMQLAVDANLSPTAIEVVLDGQPFAEVARRRLASLERIYTFFRSMPQQLLAPFPDLAEWRLKPPKRRTNRKQMREQFRGILLARYAEGFNSRTALRGVAEWPYVWARRHDRDWLEALLQDVPPGEANA
jgi:hypothetical protein